MDSAEASGEREEKEPRAGRTHNEPSKVYKVLLVEDDPVVCKIVASLLKNECNYQVSVVSNGREAMELMEGPTGETIDVILTDNLMPEVSGIELIYKLVQSERWQHVPVIVMSAESSPEVVMEAFEAGASDFLVKPIRRQELTTLWQHAWRQQRNTSARPLPSSNHPSRCSSQFGSALPSLTHYQSTGAGLEHAARQDGSDSPSPQAALRRAGSEEPSPACRPSLQAGKRSASEELRLQRFGKRMRIMDQLAEAASLRESSEERHQSGGAQLRGLPPIKVQAEDRSGTRSSEASDDTAPGAREQEATGHSLPAPMPWQSSVQGVAHVMEQLMRQPRLPSGNSSGNFLEIKPLDLSPMPDARQHSLDSLHLPGMGLGTPKSARKGEDGLAGSLEQLHHSRSHSAFSSFTAVVPRPCARGQKEDERTDESLDRVPNVFSNPQSTLLQQQQSFFNAFQAAVTQHRQNVVTCAANRKAAIAKFRAKRKSRTFEKKVRYASRQKLAEARPRVRGQFVKADVYAAHAAAAADEKKPQSAEE